MFKATLKNDTLKEILKVLRPLVSECKLVVTQDGASSRVVDEAHVAMASIELPKECFEEFKGASVMLGLDLDKLKEIVAIGRPGDSVSVEHIVDTNKLKFVVGNVTRSIGVIDEMGMADVKIPELKHTGTVRIAAAELKKGIKASGWVSTHVALKLNSLGFMMVAEGDTDTVEMAIAGEQLEVLECPEPVRSLFSLGYLESAVHSIPGEGSTMLRLGQDYPLIMEFEIAEGNGKVTILMAPRIED